MFRVLNAGPDEEDDEIAVDFGSPPAVVYLHGRDYHMARVAMSGVPATVAVMDPHLRQRPVGVAGTCQLASAMVMSPPPLWTLIVLWDSALVGTDSVSLPPSALLVMW